MNKFVRGEDEAIVYSMIFQTALFASKSKQINKKRMTISAGDTARFKL